MLRKQQLESWIKSKELLDLYKKKEMKLRIDICDDILNGRPKGTTTEILYNIEIKATKKFSATLDKELLSQLYDDFSDEERDCILFEPKLISKEYEFTQDLDKTPLLDDCITIKEVTPSLKITLPEDY